MKTKNVTDVEEIGIPTYKISKKYIGYESRNKPNYETGLTYEKAIASLDSHEILWKKNGGLVVDKTKESLTVEEDDGSQTIVFEIVEE